VRARPCAPSTRLASRFTTHATGSDCLSCHGRGPVPPELRSTANSLHMMRLPPGELPGTHRSGFAWNRFHPARAEIALHYTYFETLHGQRVPPGSRRRRRRNSRRRRRFPGRGRRQRQQRGACGADELLTGHSHRSSSRLAGLLVPPRLAPAAHGAVQRRGGDHAAVGRPRDALHLLGVAPQRGQHLT
jgi:hypothetical protein